MAKEERLKIRDEANTMMARELVEAASKSPLEKQDRGETDQEAEVATLLSHVTPDKGYYLKLYKRYPIPKEYGNKPVFLLDIEQPELIQDLESETLKLAKAYGWSDGIYEVKLYQKNVPGLQGSRRITIQVPPVAVQPPLNGAQPGSVPGVDPFTQFQNAVKLVREFTGPNGRVDADPTQMLKVVTDAFKAGADSRPAPASDPQQTQQPSVLEMIKAVKELAPPSNSHQPGPDLLVALKELGAILFPQTKKEDPLDILIKMKQAGLIPDASAKQGNAIEDAIKLLTTMAPLMESFGGGGGSSSTAVEVLKVLGPQLGEVVEKVTGTINNVIAFKAGTAGLNPPGANVRITKPTPPGGAIEPPKITNHPLIKELYIAIEKNDHNYFPKLIHGVGYWVENGDQYLQAMITDAMSFEQVMDFLIQLGGEYFRQGKAADYVKAFIDWYKRAMGSIATGANEVPSPTTAIQTEITGTVEPDADKVSKTLVTAQCDKCFELFEFDSKEAFMADNKICDNQDAENQTCAGKLTLTEA